MFLTSLPKTSSGDSGSAASFGAAAAAAAVALGSGDEAFNRNTKTDWRGEVS